MPEVYFDKIPNHLADFDAHFPALNSMCDATGDKRLYLFLPSCTLGSLKGRCANNFCGNIGTFCASRRSISRSVVVLSSLINSYLNNK